MCGPHLLPVDDAAAVTLDVAAAKPVADARTLRLRIHGALSGETLLPLVTVPAAWTVCRLRLELGRGTGIAPSEQHILTGARQLADNETLGAALPSEDQLHTLFLLRVPMPPQPVPCGSAMAHRRLTVEHPDGVSSSVTWNVDARVLRRSEKHIASPTFEMNFGPNLERIPLKLSIFAAGIGSFQRSRGVGHVQLKCVYEVPQALSSISFCVTVGKGKVGSKDAEACLRGPFSHDFGVCAVARPPKGQDVFDFAAIVDPSTNTFAITFDLAHSGEACEDARVA